MDFMPRYMAKNPRYIHGQDRLEMPTAPAIFLPLQRHFPVLTQCAHGESRLSGGKRPRDVMLYAAITLRDRRACATRVAVGLHFSAFLPHDGLEDNGRF